MVYEDFMPRIGLSLFMEFGVGLERQLTGHASGIRIYVPISPGTCLFMLFPILQRLALSLPRAGGISVLPHERYAGQRKGGVPHPALVPEHRRHDRPLRDRVLDGRCGGVQERSFVRRMTACLALAGLDAGHIGKADAARAAPYAAPT